MVKNYGWAAKDASGKYSPFEYEIREPGEDEIIVQVKYCGICHSDIHTARSEWGNPSYPVVTGHEFIGAVCKVGPFKSHAGADAAKYIDWKVGDIVGVGCLVGSCGNCIQCSEDWENHCPKNVGTYDSKDSHGQNTYGGYGKYVVLNRRFAVRIPAGVDYKDAAPLLCAGITTFSPLNQNQVERGNLRVGVLGLGGLGHMAVQYAAKMNSSNEVIVLSRNNKKEELAKKLGAKKLVAVGDADFVDGKLVKSNPDLDAVMGTFDYIVDTVVTSKKPMTLYANLLKPRGAWIMVGLPPVCDPLTLPTFPIVARNRKLLGSCIGGIAETQKMVDFSFKNKIMPMVEHIKADQINEAIERVIKGDVTFRFVIDVEESYAGKAE